MLTETFNDAACSSEDILFLDIVCRFDVGFRPESFLDIITVQFSVFLLTSNSYVVMQAVPWVVSSAVAVCQLPPLVQVASCVLQHYYRENAKLASRGCVVAIDISFSKQRWIYIYMRFFHQLFKIPMYLRCSK